MFQWSQPGKAGKAGQMQLLCAGPQVAKPKERQWGKEGGEGNKGARVKGWRGEGNPSSSRGLHSSHPGQCVKRASHPPLCRQQGNLVRACSRPCDRGDAKPTARCNPLPWGLCRLSVPGPPASTPVIAFPHNPEAEANETRASARLSLHLPPLHQRSASRGGGVANHDFQEGGLRGQHRAKSQSRSEPDPESPLDTGPPWRIAGGRGATIATRPPAQRPINPSSRPIPFLARGKAWGGTPKQVA